MSSTLPIIIKKIRKNLVKKWRSLKLKSFRPYVEEFTVFINVSIDNLNEFSKLISLKLNNEVKTKREIIKIIIVKKYLFISLKSKLILENNNLFIKTFFGLLKDKIWLREYFVSEYIFKNLNPELVEKKDPPIITRIK